MSEQRKYRSWTGQQKLGPLRDLMLAENRAFWRYRVALHDAALSALRC